MRLAVSALFLIGFAFGSAAADTKVDWSQYLEQPGDRVPKKKTTPVAAEAVKPVKKAKAPRAAAAKPRPAKAIAKRKPGRQRR